MLAHRIRHRLATAYAVILFAALTAPAYAAGLTCRGSSR
jgi:hypothetical protein